MKLDTYSFTREDMHLITFALRRFSTQTRFIDLKDQSIDLIWHIERMMQEKADVKRNAKSRLKN